MKLIDVDKLKSFIDKTQEEDESKYKRLYEQAIWERDMLEDQLDQTVSTYFLEDWLGKNLFEKLLYDYQHRFTITEGIGVDKNVKIQNAKILHGETK